MSADVNGFTSAPIKLAAIINNRRMAQQAEGSTKKSVSFGGSANHLLVARRGPQANEGISENASNGSGSRSNHHSITRRSTLPSGKQTANVPVVGVHLHSSASLVKLAASNHKWLLLTTVATLLVLVYCSLVLPLPSQADLLNVGLNGDNIRSPLNQHRSLRHQAHYLNINPLAHFRYNEGRQLGGLFVGGQQARHNQQALAAQNERTTRQESSIVAAATVGQHQPSSILLLSPSAHIYKRSSALISSSVGAHYPPLVSSMRPALNPLSRRMMSEGSHTRWTSPKMIAAEQQQQQQQAAASGTSGEEQQLSELLSLHLNDNQQQAQEIPEARNLVAATTASQGFSSGSQQATKSLALKRLEEAESLRQKQAIQYHDQWPSMAGKCHKRTLNFCASVLPFNTTTFPNIIGDTSRFEVKRSLPFFGFLAKSSCNKRLDELLCLLLEPPCGAHSGLAIPPCKKFCRLALEGCNEYIPATLAMSSVFDCRQYPDSNDPNVCVNLAQGSKCGADEFKCPDKTCIPRNWLCDGVRDCIFAADEANCTELTGVGLQTTSVCSTEEFKCDGKCVPKAWKCDSERDCLDGSDEESCGQRPRCGPDRFRCADGNGCLPKRWVCDGKAECRDGSDELNCEQLACSVNDFKCDNGICIPKLWRCDRQSDCKDGSDERNCTYAFSTTHPTAITTIPPKSEMPTTLYVNNSYLSSVAAPSSPIISASEDGEQVQSQPQSPAEGPADSQQMNPVNHYAASELQQQQPARLHLESNLNDDVSRIIQQESAVAASSITPPSPSSSSLSPVVLVQEQQQQESDVYNEPSASVPAPSGGPLDAALANKQQQAAAATATAKELKKFDYDIIQSASSLNQIQLNELASNNELLSANQQQQQSAAQPQQQQQYHQPKKQQMLTQIDFIPQQQPQQHQTLRQISHANPSFAGSQDAERVPIYRSLFKTLKGGQGRVLGSPISHGQHHNRYSASGRRIRRERHNNIQQQPVVTMTTVSIDNNPHSSVSPAESVPLSSPVPHHQYRNNQHQQQVANYTAQISASPIRSHSVASYLQLLNSRYNLRLPRMPPQSVA